MRPGDVVAARWQLLEVSGTGGMGTVHRARELETGAIVALKLLGWAEPEELARFEREVRILSELRHPAIVRYVAHGTIEPNRPYLVMEWLEGETLGDRLDRGPLELDQISALIRRLAGALAAAHARGVVHRDVKPANVFLVGGRTEDAKLIDFGIARMVGGTRALTRTDVPIGTPAYMAPEQIRGRRDIDGRADLFGLGCVLYRAITGRPAFGGEDLVAVITKILVDDPPRPSEVVVGLPPEIDALVLRMLAKEPEKRPASAQALLEELEATTQRAIRLISVPPASGDRISEGEQRLISVLIGIAPPTLELDAQQLDQAERFLGGLGLRTDAWDDGTLVATSRSSQDPGEQAVRVARGALEIHRRLPSHRLAVASIRVELGARSPFGEVVDRAAALLRVPATTGADSAPCGVRIDELTASLIGARFEIALDGAGSVLQAEREPARGPSLPPRPASPWVGRERQLAQLVATWSECVEDSVARAVLVTGPAGIGKSRLAQELTRRLEEQATPCQLWSAHGDPLGRNAAYGLVGSLLAGLFGLAEGELLVERQRKLVARVCRHVELSEHRRVSEFIGEIVGAPFSDDDSPALRAARRDPTLMHEQVRRAWLELVTAEVAAEPLLLLLEDLHWTDRPSLELLDAALGRCQAAPLLVLGLGRPELDDTHARLWADWNVESVRLPPLTPNAARSLVQRTLGSTLDREKVEALVERAGGNPLFLEELVRAVSEGRHDAPPETVLAMVEARLRRFEPEARQVLRGASVFGSRFWQGAVERLLGSESREKVSGWLEVLDEHDVVRQCAPPRFPAEREFVFRHALLREAAYAMLTDDDRTLGHRLAAAWLEEAGEHDPALLAEHWARGGDPERARRWCEEAARRALDANDFSAAGAWADRGLGAGATGTERARLQCLRAESDYWTGDLERAASTAWPALQSLTPASVAWCRCIGVLISVYSQRADRAGLGRLADLLDAPTLPVADDEAWLLAMRARLCGGLLLAGERRRATEMLERTEARAAKLSTDEPSLTARLEYARVMLAFAQGEPEAAARHAAAAAAANERAGHVRNAVTAEINHGYALLQLGDTARAERTLRNALERCVRIGLGALAAAARQNLGLALARLGRQPEALTVLAEAAASGHARGDRRMESASRAYLGRVLLELGELARAEQEARRAVELAAEIPAIRAQSLAVLGAVLLGSDRAGEALAVSREALALLGEQPSVEDDDSLLAVVHAKALVAIGARDEARRAAAAAHTRLAASAERISEPALRHGFLERVPEHAELTALVRSLESS